MAKHKILYTRKDNENATTALDPIAVWSGQVDLEATGSFCASFDFDMLVSAKLYEVREIELPDWLAPEEWIANEIQWRYVWGSGVSREWPESWQRGLARLPFSERYAICKLLSVKNFRSEFRRSLRDQVATWLETPADDRQFPRPLSVRQLDAIAPPRWEVSRAEAAIYRNR